MLLLTQLGKNIVESNFAEASSCWSFVNELLLFVSGRISFHEMKSREIFLKIFLQGKQAPDSILSHPILQSIDTDVTRLMDVFINLSRWFQHKFSAEQKVSLGIQ